MKALFKRLAIASTTMLASCGGDDQTPGAERAADAAADGTTEGGANVPDGGADDRTASDGGTATDGDASADGGLRPDGMIADGDDATPDGALADAPDAFVAKGAIVIDPLSELVTTELGGVDSFTVHLDSMPVSNVTLVLASSLLSEGTVSPGILTFTPADFAKAQKVTVTGVNDSLVDGDRSYTILTAPAISNDPRFSFVDPDDVSVTNVDDDTPNVIVTPMRATIGEIGGIAEFVFTLTTKPTAEVTIPVTSAGATVDFNLSADKVTLGPNNWNTGATTGSIRVTAIKDTVAEGADVHTLTTGAITSTDPAYGTPNLVPTPDPVLTIVDSEGPPGLSPATGMLAYVEGVGAVAIDGAITVSDPDSAALAGITVTLTSPVGGQDVLGCTAAPPVNCPATSSTGSITLTGAGTPAQYQAVLRRVTYNNTSDAPDTTPRTVTISASDGSYNATPVTRTIAVTSVNDAPVLSPASGTVSYTENAPPVPVAPGILVGDPDSPTLTTVTVVLTNGLPAEDVLHCASALPITCPATSVTGSMTLTGPGAPSDFTTVLAGVSYSNVSENPSSANRELTITAFDELTSSSVTRSITVVPVNDAPVLGPDGTGVAYVENDAPVIFAADLTATDIDSATFTGATVSVDGGASTEILHCTSAGGISCPSLATTPLKLTGKATIAEYLSVLRVVSYESSDDGPPATHTITITIDDNGTTASTTRVVAVTPINDPPVTKFAPGPLIYTEGIPPTSPWAQGGTVFDPDSPTLTFMRVGITGPTAGGPPHVVTCVDTPPVACAPLAANQFTLLGPATPAQFQAALANVRYFNASESPAGSVSVFMDANDGSQGLLGTAVLDLIAVDDPPVLELPPSQPVLSATSRTVSPPITVSDIDGSTVTVTLSGPMTTTSFDATAMGSAVVTGVGTSALKISGSIADVNDVLATLRASVAEQPTTTVTVTADDGGGPTGVTSRPLRFDAFDSVACTDDLYGGHHYFFCKQPLTAADASTACTDRSAQLTSINDSAENTFLTGKLPVSGWVGVGDLAEEGCYQLFDGSGPVSAGATTCPASGFSMWAQNEPNNMGNEDCVELLTQGTWNDLPCSQVRYFICEHPRL